MEELGLPADAPVFGEKREAAGAVAAHLAFRPVGVVITHRTVDLRVPGEGHQPVGSDAEMTVAQGCDKFRTGCEAAFAVVDQDEVVACAFVFCKCRLHFLMQSSIKPIAVAERSKFCHNRNTVLIRNWNEENY